MIRSRIAIWALAPWLVAWTFSIAGLTRVQAGYLDDVGVTLLRQVDPALQGSNVPVAQVEGPLNENPPYYFEVNPSVAGLPVSRFNYYSDLGAATAQFPNSVGDESGHADTVATYYYAPATGVAPQVSSVDNYEAHYFLGSVIGGIIPPAIAAVIVNQSFILYPDSETAVNQDCDNYVAQHGTLFVSAVGNGGTVSSPGTCYNGVGVGLSDALASVGPTTDGRCKPDLVAPGGATSYSTPIVSGAAAILRQAAVRGDGGSGAATNSRVLKVLLMNGALKPAGWSNNPAVPLDLRYGAGVLNVFNSWRQLAGGLHAVTETTTVSSGGAHPPGSVTNNVSSLTGWNLGSLSTSPVQDKVDHYYFTLPSAGAGMHTATVTLSWNRQANQTGINNLDLFLYHVASGNLITCSTSTVDNVEHAYVAQLPAGRYDLQVLKRGSFTQVSSSETYALAFEFFSQPLAVARSNSSWLVSWPLAPMGFTLQSANGMALPVTWTDVATAPSVVSNRNQVVLAAGTNRFFRLRRD